jgi:hypothetical protein
MGFPAMGARTLPGNLDEENLAGMTPRILRGTRDHTIKRVMLFLVEKGWQADAAVLP